MKVISLVFLICTVSTFHSSAQDYLELAKRDMVSHNYGQMIYYASKQWEIHETSMCAYLLAFGYYKEGKLLNAFEYSIMGLYKKFDKNIMYSNEAKKQLENIFRISKSSLTNSQVRQSCLLLLSYDGENVNDMEKLAAMEEESLTIQEVRAKLISVGAPDSVLANLEDSSLNQLIEEAAASVLNTPEKINQEIQETFMLESNSSYDIQFDQHIFVYWDPSPQSEQEAIDTSYYYSTSSYGYNYGDELETYSLMEYPELFAPDSVLTCGLLNLLEQFEVGVQDDSNPYVIKYKLNSLNIEPFCEAVILREKNYSSLYEIKESLCKKP